MGLWTLAVGGAQALGRVVMFASAAAAYLLGWEAEQDGAETSGSLATSLPLQCQTSPSGSLSPQPSPQRASSKSPASPAPISRHASDSRLADERINSKPSEPEPSTAEPKPRPATPEPEALSVQVSTPQPSPSSTTKSDPDHSGSLDASPLGGGDSGVSEGGTAEEETIVVDEADYRPHLHWAPRTQPVLLHYSEGYEDYYERHEEIGVGKFGRVYRCVEKASGAEFAGKWVRGRGSKARKEVDREIEILKELQHPQIIHLHEVFACPGSEVVLVMERIEGGELFERVVGEEYILSEAAAKQILRQICEAAAYIHSKSVVHLDLKPENILFLSLRGNRIKIIDFGLAQRVNASGHTEDRVVAGTAEFISPEVVNYEPVSLATDLWSIGVMAYLLLSGVSPFLGDNNTETYVNVTRGEWSFDEEAFEDVSQESRDFCSALIRYKKEERLSSLACLSHPWLRRSPQEEDFARPLNTERLHRYVVRRRWKRAFHAVIAIARLRAGGSSKSTTPTSEGPNSDEAPRALFADFDAAWSQCQGEGGEDGE